MKRIVFLAMFCLLPFFAPVVCHADAKVLVIKVQKVEALKFGTNQMYLVTMNNGDAVSINGANFPAGTAASQQLLSVNVLKVEKLRPDELKEIKYLVTMKNGDAVSINGANIDFAAGTAESIDYRY